ncbi:MAG: hypothetical protein P4L69_13460, partial [Desulfosporosinus sp.]|nr:hypothetical protein [Desulfosporosinus sp.]
AMPFAPSSPIGSIGVRSYIGIAVPILSCQRKETRSYFPRLPVCIIAPAACLYMHDDDDIRSLPIRSSHTDLLATYSRTRVNIFLLIIIPRCGLGCIVPKLTYYVRWRSVSIKRLLTV